MHPIQLAAVMKYNHGTYSKNMTLSSTRSLPVSDSDQELIFWVASSTQDTVPLRMSKPL